VSEFRVDPPVAGAAGRKAAIDGDVRRSRRGESETSVEQLVHRCPHDIALRNQAPQVGLPPPARTSFGDDDVLDVWRGRAWAISVVDLPDVAYLERLDAIDRSYSGRLVQQSLVAFGERLAQLAARSFRGSAGGVSCLLLGADLHSRRELRKVLIADAELVEP
jgi:hypothetical protein